MKKKRRMKRRIQRILYTSLFGIAIVSVVLLLLLAIKYISTIGKESQEKDIAVVYGNDIYDVDADAFINGGFNLAHLFDAVAETTQEEMLSENDMSDVEAIVADMTLDEKVYQLFIVTPEALTGVGTVVSAGDTTKSCMEKYPVGGLVYLAKNLTDPAQTKEMLSKTQSYADEIEGMPIFLCLDEEGGRVARVGGNAAFNVKKVVCMKDIADSEAAYEAGNTIGEYLDDLGFNFDFAPDADVLTNPNSKVIGDRSFGDDPERVASCAKAFSDGLHNHGIMSTYKHFPGHGAVEADTHAGYAYTDKSYSDLQKVELVPFARASEGGIDAIMVAHISLPNVVGDDTPASMSKKVVTDILRTDLQYDGLVVTDALNMGAISNSYSSGEAAIKAFNAGVDILLMPADFKSAAADVKAAVENGTISEERLNESVKRIVRAKMKLSFKVE